MLTDREHKNLQRLIKKNNVETKEEMDVLMSSLIGGKIPNVVNYEDLSDEDKALELIYDAKETEDFSILQSNLKKALELDSLCTDGYELSADLTDNLFKKRDLYIKAIESFEIKKGESYFEENMGRFWKIAETRSYMRCLQSLSDNYLETSEFENSCGILQDLIELNPDDNQGARDVLGLLLTHLNSNVEFDSLTKQFKEDSSAFVKYNIALNSFLRFGALDEKTQNAKKNALSTNEFVAEMLINGQRPLKLPEMYQRGSMAEANYIMYFSYNIWKKNKGAIKWISE